MGERSETHVPRTRFRDLLSRSSELYGDHARSLVGLFVGLYAPLSVLQAGVTEGIDLATLPSTLGAFVVVLLQFVLPAFAGSVAVAATARLASPGWPDGAVAALGSLRPHWREVTSAALLASVLSMISWFVPASGLLFPLFFGPPVIIHLIVLEGLPLRAAWPQAKSLLKGNWGRILLHLIGISALISLVQLVVIVGIAAGVGAAWDVSDSLRDFIFRGPVGGILLGLVLPYLSAATYVVYKDLRALASSAE